MAKKPKPIDVTAAIEDDPLLKPIPELAARDGLTAYEVKQLRGKIHVDSLHNPIGNLEHDLVRDDRRYAKWLKSIRPVSKSKDPS